MAQAYKVIERDGRFVMAGFMTRTSSHKGNIWIPISEHGTKAEAQEAIKKQLLADYAAVRELRRWDAKQSY